MITMGGLALAVLRGEVAAQDSLPSFSVPFGVGERLVYTARFGPITVGEGTMEVLEIQDVRGIDAWHTRFQLKGGLAFYKADFLLESWFDMDRFNSLRFVNDSESGGKVREKRYEIFPDRQLFQENQLPEQPSVPDPLDEGALLYFVRTMDLEVGKTYELNRYFRPDRNPVIVKVLRRERVSVPAGTFNTIVIQPIIKTRGIFSEGGQALVWISDDKDRTPVQLRVRLTIGSISLFLKSHTPPKGATLQPDTTASR
jgi:hypothetical protein